MAIDVLVAAPEAVEADLLAVPVTDPPAPLTGAAGELDARLGGRLRRLAADGELRGSPDSVSVLHLEGDARVRRVAAAGVGAAARVDADALRTAAGAVARLGRDLGGTVAWTLDASLPPTREEQGRALVEGTILGGYDAGIRKTNGRRAGIERIVIATDDPASVRSAVDRAGRVAAWANRARDLTNLPANELTPERLAERADEIAEGSETLSAESLGPEAIRELGMGAFAAVGQGSHNGSRLIVMRYDPPAEAPAEVTLGLVGKAITFDTGGITLKPGLYMEDMKGDMAGGAAVVESMGALAELELPLRTLAVVAAAENMPGGGSFRPGDILRAMNGKTIEVISTDAEGRLVLADALWYAREQGATHLLDLATLTGAMELALGDLYAGVFANDDAWRDLVVRSGEASGDHVWPFPLHPRYRRYIDSDFADMKNSSILKQGSPALAAEFLHEFAGEGPWAHLDIAGPAFFRYSRGDYLTQKGGTGYGVRLVVEVAGRLADGEAG